jgi:hypothetical protein
MPRLSLDLSWSLSSVSRQYKIKRGDRIFGPYSTAEVRQLAANEKLEPTDLIREQGGQRWALASTVAGLGIPAPVISSTSSVETPGTATKQLIDRRPESRSPQVDSTAPSTSSNSAPSRMKRIIFKSLGVVCIAASVVTWFIIEPAMSETYEAGPTDVGFLGTAIDIAAVLLLVGGIVFFMTARGRNLLKTVTPDEMELDVSSALCWANVMYDVKKKRDAAMAGIVVIDRYGVACHPDTELNAITQRGAIGWLLRCMGGSKTTLPVDAATSIPIKSIERVRVRGLIMPMLRIDMTTEIAESKSMYLSFAGLKGKRRKRLKRLSKEIQAVQQDYLDSASAAS